MVKNIAEASARSSAAALTALAENLKLIAELNKKKSDVDT